MRNIDDGKRKKRKKKRKEWRFQWPLRCCQQSTARTATPERRPLERRTLVPIMMEIVATNVITIQPPERQPTDMPTDCNANRLQYRLFQNLFCKSWFEPPKNTFQTILAMLAPHGGHFGVCCEWPQHQLIFVYRVTRMKVQRVTLQPGWPRYLSRWTLTRTTSSRWRSSRRGAEMIPGQYRHSLYNQIQHSRDPQSTNQKLLINSSQPIRTIHVCNATIIYKSTKLCMTTIITYFTSLPNKCSMQLLSYFSCPHEFQ